MVRLSVQPHRRLSVPANEPYRRKSANSYWTMNDMTSLEKRDGVAPKCKLYFKSLSMRRFTSHSLLVPAGRWC